MDYNVIDFMYFKHEPKGYICDRPMGTNDFLFLHFINPVDVLVGGQIVRTAPNACLIYSPHTPHFYVAVTHELLHNWLHFVPLAENTDLIYMGPTVYNDMIGSGCTDMGDISSIMPVVHPLIPGAAGKSHGSDFKICNTELACVASAKWQLAMLVLLLKDNAVRAKQIIKEYKPIFDSKEAYFRYIDDLNSDGYRIKYREDGVAEIKL